MEELYVILCKKVTKKINEQYTKIFLENETQFVFVSDYPPDIPVCDNIIYYEDNVVMDNGFWGMHSKIKVTSWDKAFYYLSKKERNFKYCWMIEDDCYINKDKFMKFKKDFVASKDSDAVFFGWHKDYKNGDDWYHWNINKDYFSKYNLSASINQIIRLSDCTINKILDFQKKYNKFIFHELLFASIVNQHNLKKTLVKNEEIHCTALYKNSIIYNKYTGYNSNELLKSISDNYIIVHPFKGWFNI